MTNPAARRFRALATCAITIAMVSVGVLASASPASAWVPPCVHVTPDIDAGDVHIEGISRWC